MLSETNSLAELKGTKTKQFYYGPINTEEKKVNLHDMHRSCPERTLARTSALQGPAVKLEQTMCAQDKPEHRESNRKCFLQRVTEKFSQPRRPTSGFASGTDGKMKMGSYVHCSLGHTSQNVETTYMSIAI